MNGGGDLRVNQISVKDFLQFKKTSLQGGL